MAARELPNLPLADALQLVISVPSAGTGGFPRWKPASQAVEVGGGLPATRILEPVRASRSRG